MDLTYKIERSIPWVSPTDRQIYCATIERLGSRIESCKILDMGGGRECKFSEVAKSIRASVTAVDISPEELALNDTINDKIVADVCAEVPLPSGSADMVVSYAVIEHLPDVRPYLNNCYRLLRPNGFTVHMIPNRWSIASVLNRIVGNKLARRLLNRFKPESRGKLGFRAYYNGCSPKALRQLFEQEGFERIQIVPYFYQSDYYHRIPPVYLISVAWEWLTWKLQISSLCSSFVVSAGKLSAD